MDAEIEDWDCMARETVHRQFIIFVAASAVLLFVILANDRDGFVPQLILGGTTAAFLLYFARRSRVAGRQIACAVVIATVGEIALSLIWGLYSYRHAVIPFYVPPGHGVFYLLAAETAAQPWIQRWARPVTLFVMTAGSVIAIIGGLVFSDTWGLLWWLVALVVLLRSRNAVLLSVCFTYTTLLEWAGTANGNWQWAEIVPYVGLRSANPPAGVGVLYIVLDVLVVLVSSRVGASSLTASEADPGFSEG